MIGRILDPVQLLFHRVGMQRRARNAEQRPRQLPGSEVRQIGMAANPATPVPRNN